MTLDSEGTRQGETDDAQTDSQSEEAFQAKVNIANAREVARETQSQADHTTAAANNSGPATSIAKAKQAKLTVEGTIYKGDSDESERYESDKGKGKKKGKSKVKKSNTGAKQQKGQDRKLRSQNNPNQK